MPDHLRNCPRCLEDQQVRQRDFSDQAAAALLVWQEIDPSYLGKPICASCYEELREVLIDRAHELEEAASQPIPAARPAEIVEASPGAPAKEEVMVAHQATSTVKQLDVVDQKPEKKSKDTDKKSKTSAKKAKSSVKKKAKTVKKAKKKIKRAG